MLKNKKKHVLNLSEPLSTKIIQVSHDLTFEKLPFPFLLMTIVVYSSCKKSGGTTPPPVSQPTYYLHCTINGVDKKFDNSLTATKEETTRPGFLVTSLVVWGNGTNETFNFSINNYFSGYSYPSPLPIVPGDYSVKNSPFSVTLEHDDHNTTNKYYRGDYTSMYPDSSNFTITLTSIDSVAIKGTFSGKLYLDHNSTGATSIPYGPEYETVTNGTFYIGLK